MENILNRLKPYTDLKGSLIEFVGRENILNLAKEGICPHYILTIPSTNEQKILFIRDEVDEWLQYHYLKKVSPDNLKEVRFNIFDLNKFSLDGQEEIPPLLYNIEELYKLPLENIYTSSGVYFLCKGTKIVYIGQSKNISNRIITHLFEEKKEFIQVFFIRIPVSQLDDVEKSLIRYLKPIYNMNCLKDIGNFPIEKAKEILNC
jgi:hypothetical protein